VAEAQRAKPSVPVSLAQGRYEVLLPIAKGGMATVFLGRMSSVGGFERDVAVKLPHPHLLKSEGFREDFVEEAKLAAQIRHPNVVATLDVGQTADGVFMVMEYVEGESLRGLRRVAWANEERLPTRIGLAILLDGLEGLHAAHELRSRDGEPLGLVHRDFSPHNILVGTDGIGRLADFGIAKAASRLGDTATGLVKGKLPYLAPEQARGLKLDRRADVWAAGVLAWEIATGQRMYSRVDEVAHLARLVSKTPPRARTVAREVSYDLDEAIAGALTLERDQRYSTAEEFALALRAALPSQFDLALPVERGAYVEQQVGDQIELRRSQADLVWRERRSAKSAEPARPSTSGIHVAPAHLRSAPEDPVVVVSDAVEEMVLADLAAEADQMAPSDGYAGGSPGHGLHGDTETVTVPLAYRDDSIPEMPAVARTQTVAAQRPVNGASAAPSIAADPDLETSESELPTKVRDEPPENTKTMPANVRRLAAAANHAVCFDEAPASQSTSVPSQPSLDLPPASDPFGGSTITDAAGSQLWRESLRESRRRTTVLVVVISVVIALVATLLLASAPEDGDDALETAPGGRP
jgi:serine/threonine-protein kinase